VGFMGPVRTHEFHSFCIHMRRTGMRWREATQALLMCHNTANACNLRGVLCFAIEQREGEYGWSERHTDLFSRLNVLSSEKNCRII